MININRLYKKKIGRFIYKPFRMGYNTFCAIIINVFESIYLRYKEG